MSEWKSWGSGKTAIFRIAKIRCRRKLQDAVDKTDGKVIVVAKPASAVAIPGFLFVMLAAEDCDEKIRVIEQF